MRQKHGFRFVNLYFWQTDALYFGEKKNEWVKRQNLKRNLSYKQTRLKCKSSACVKIVLKKDWIVKNVEKM